MAAKKRVDWTPRKRSRIVVLHESGLSYAEIARQVGQTTSGVRKFCLRYKETKSIKNKAGKGRKKCTKYVDDRRIMRLCLKDRKMSSKAISGELGASGVSVSSRTIRRRLSDLGLKDRIPRKKPYLNPQQRLKRQQWAKEHSEWTEDQWKQVIWSDETNMASSPSVLMRLMASAYSIANKAGTIVRKVMAGGDLGIVEKCGANDLQTKADRLVQMSICSSLARKFPKVTIIGEEDLPSEEVNEDLLEDGQCEEILKKACPQQYTAIKEEELVVWVDPLDGTKEYTEGLLDHVTVLIGIAYEGKAIAGVINQPYYNYEAGSDAVLGRTIWGVLGLGAFGFQLKEMPAGKHIITTTRSHSSKLVNDCISAMNPDSVVRVGGAGNKIIQLIEGKASAYVFASPGCKKWDTCAPEAILHAVGGKLTDIHGNFFHYNKEVKHMNSGGVLAALNNHDYYASRVPETVKQALVP